MAGTHHYALLEPEAEGEPNARKFREPSKIINRRVLAIFSSTLCIALLGLLLGFFATTPYKSPNCGSTPAEARAKGCGFEPWTRSWVPKPCYKLGPLGKHNSFDDRQWYYDVHLTRPMNQTDFEKMRAGDYVVAYAKIFHDEHCLYAMRKLATAVEEKWLLVDSLTMDAHHVRHCSLGISNVLYEIGTYGAPLEPDESVEAPCLYRTCIPLFLGWRQRLMMSLRGL